MSWLSRTDDRTKHHYTEECFCAYLDGELSPQERRAVEQHLATCSTCQWQLDTLRQTVQWCRTLPTVPVPRVFTIPPFTEPVPAPRRALTPRPRSFVPVLQGATALLALLLFFVVAGDILLTGVLPAGAPQPVPAAVMEQAATQVEVTQEVELAAAEAAAEPTVPAEAEAMAAKAAPESGQEPPPAPAEPIEAPAMAAEAVSTDVPQPEAAVVAATAAPEANVTGAMGLEPAAGKGGEEPPAATGAVTEARAAAPAATATEAMTLTAMLADTAQPTPTVTPTMQVIEVPTVPPATAVAEVQPPAPAAPAEDVHETSESMQPLFVTSLRAVEAGLGVALVLVAAITLAAMIQRRRTR